MSTKSLEFTGGCHCGAVRYRSSAAPLMTRVCWCRDCQYFGAGSGTVNAVFARSTFTVTGRLGDYSSLSAAGNVMHRKFCSACGTPLFSEAEVRPTMIIVRAGTLDDPNCVTPSMTIWTDSAPQWACFDADLPQHAAGPPP